MRIPALGISLLLASFSALAHADEPFRDDLDCIKAVRDCSSGKSLFVDTSPSHQYVLLFEARESVDGFYAFSGEDGYFHKLPPPLKVEPVKKPAPSLWNLYGVLTPKPAATDPRPRFKLEAGIHDPVYLTFNYDGERPVLESVARQPAAGLRYLDGTGGECHADAASRAALRAETLARIGSVYDTWASSPEPEAGDVRQEMTLVGRERPKFFKIEECRKGLETCALSSELRSAAQSQLAKFPPRK